MPLESILWARVFGGQAKTPRKILVVNGDPDPGPEHFCAALCGAYQEGVRSGGGDVRSLDVGALRCAAERFADTGQIENALREMDWASQLTVIFHLLRGRLPANLVALFELASYRGVLPAAQGQVRTIITMEYPAFAQRALLQDIGGAIGPNYRLSLPGCGPPLLIGSIQALSPAQRAAWLESLRSHGVRDAKAGIDAD